jgi:catechol 2,3-dioxygenase-like lactoylglutathione lyase family enzyme
VLDHVGIGVSDLERSRGFYEDALAPLDMSVVLAFPGAVGFGRDGKPWFWIEAGRPVGPMHVAFMAIYASRARARAPARSGGRSERKVSSSSVNGCWKASSALWRNWRARPYRPARP